MENTNKSNLAFRSNLQPFTGQSFLYDTEFLAKIHDPSALQKMKDKGLQLTAIQEEELRNRGHCSYADQDEFPYGSILDDSGKRVVKCKCTKQACQRFSQCRPDFKGDELCKADSNDLEKVAQFEKLWQKITERKAITEKNKNNKPLKETPTSPTARNIELSVATPKEPTIDRQQAAAAFGKLLHENTKPAMSPASMPKIAKMAMVNERLTARKEEAPAMAAPWTEIAPLPPSTSTPMKYLHAFSAKFEPVSQKDIIELDVTERTIVNAGPGTGKTWTLIQRLKYLLNHDADPYKILVLCFSRAAIEIIRHRLEEAAENGDLGYEWRNMEIRTFDSFCTYMLSYLKGEEPERLPADFSLWNKDYEDRIRAALEMFEENNDLLADLGLQHLMVDEVQDLVGSRAELVLRMLAILPEDCGFTLLGDSCQGIYDYLSQKDNRLMSSIDFYNQLAENYSEAHWFSLKENHRQTSALKELATEYRAAILDGNEEKSNDALATVAKIIRSQAKETRSFDNTEQKYTSKETLGILTRTNGQALLISSYLHKKGIEHEHKKSTKLCNFGAWIGTTFWAVEGGVINEKLFKKAFERFYDGDAEAYWQALCSSQREGKNYYDKDELLKTVLWKGKDPLLYREPGEEAQNAITVSTIHRAKGREFDTVCLLEDLLKPKKQEAANNAMLEHRVSYVALTRPRSKIFTIPDKDYMYIFQIGKRCLKFTKNTRYIAKIEFGLEGDVDNLNCAPYDDLQKYLSEVRANNRREIKLIKAYSDGYGYVPYKIVPEYNQQLTLGYTSKKFSWALRETLCKAWDASPDTIIKVKYYPDEFRGLYFERLSTCLSAVDAPCGAKKIGDLNMWNSLVISGFADAIRYRY